MGEGGVKTPEKLPTSFMDGPFAKLFIAEEDEEVNSKV